MKNIQVIDGADNATFSVFQATHEEFAQLFPGSDQDIELAEDFLERTGEHRGSAILEAIWQRPILKRDALGIHGTLYFDHASKRQHLPKTKREVDFDASSINEAQRRLFAKERSQ